MSGQPKMRTWSETVWFVVYSKCTCNIIWIMFNWKLELAFIHFNHWGWLSKTVEAIFILFKSYMGVIAIVRSYKFQRDCIIWKTKIALWVCLQEMLQCNDPTRSLQKYYYYYTIIMRMFNCSWFVFVWLISYTPLWFKFYYKNQRQNTVTKRPNSDAFGYPKA